MTSIPVPTDPSSRNALHLVRSKINELVERQNSLEGDYTTLGKIVHALQTSYHELATQQRKLKDDCRSLTDKVSKNFKGAEAKHVDLQNAQTGLSNYVKKFAEDTMRNFYDVEERLSLQGRLTESSQDRKPKILEIPCSEDLVIQKELESLYREVKNLKRKISTLEDVSEQTSKDVHHKLELISRKHSEHTYSVKQHMESDEAPHAKLGDVINKAYGTKGRWDQLRIEDGYGGKGILLKSLLQKFKYFHLAHKEQSGLVVDRVNIDSFTDCLRLHCPHVYHEGQKYSIFDVS